MIRSATPPNIVESFPTDFLILLPNNSPSKVKIPLMKENVIVDKIKFGHIFVKVMPTEKLSILTAKAKRKYSTFFITFIFSSFLNDSYIMSIPIIERTAQTIKLGFIFKIFNNLFPIRNPINGIKKWKRPTIIDNRYTCFFFIPRVP